MTNIAGWVIVLALVSASVGHAAPQAKFPREARELAEQQTVPALSWAIVVHGRVSAGSLIRKNGALRPSRRELYYHAASVTKSVAATGVLLLAQNGLLSLHSQAALFLEDLAVDDPRWQTVTIEQLLSHLSGLSDVGTGLRDHRDYVWQEARDWLRQPGRIMFDQDPGVGHSYSNLNYVLLGRVIENASGESFGDFIVHHVLSPNGARKARLSCFELPEAQVAAPHTLDGQGKVVPSQLRHLGRSHAASSGLCITAPELATWAARTLDCRRRATTLTCDSVANMLRPRMGNYGLGWEHTELGGHQVYGHSGADAGYASALLVVPDSDISVAVLTNMTFSSAAEMARMLLARLLGGQILLTNHIPPVSAWPAFAGYFSSPTMGCARIESTEKSLILVRQQLNFPYEVTRMRLMPKPDWDDGYFIGVHGGSPVWFGAAPQGGLKDPEAASLFMDHQRFNRTRDPGRDCADLR